VSVNTDSFFIPAIDLNLIRSIGWKEDFFENGWSGSTNLPENGSMSVLSGETLMASFDASVKNVWQTFMLSIPNVDVSQYHYLGLDEKIDATSYNLGYIRATIGGYTYTIRGWTDETKSPGHPWKTYVFDLSEATPEKNDAPVHPEGPITRISWLGYSTGENGGTAKLQIDNIALSSSYIIPIAYGEVNAYLDLSEANLVLVDNVPIIKKTLDNITINGMEIYGLYNSTFKNANAMLDPPGIGKYSKITFDEGCTMTLSLASNSSISLTTLVSGNPSELVIRGGIIHANLTSSEKEFVVYINEAQLSANGYTRFEKAFISWPYNIYDPELPMEVTGPITFKVNAMDQGYSLISELELKGTYKVLTQQKVTWNEWNIPWIAVLTSPWHILLVSAIATMIVAYEAKRRYHFKIKTKRFHKSRGSVQS
jgi:hypothetical protein